ncbi:MAG TPA: InlB B-repeat-containing protein, partial [Bacilli bacterium]|nr:InlB B-repeat-containing protein [Bacilli bacterium]
TAPTKTGYTFGGWYTTNAYTTAFDFDTLITANTTIYAKWTINTYTVTFDVDGGSSVSAQVVDYNQKATLPTAPTKTGYTFGGWYTTNAFTTAFDFDTLITANTTIYAKWNILTYTLTFDVDGGSAVDTQTLAYNVKPTIPLMPTKTGYTFDGWFTDNTLTTPYNFDAVLTTNQTAYAKWIINTYTVTFESNDGTMVANQTINYGGTVVTPTAPTKTGYTFDGWYANSELTTAYNFSNLVTANMTLYAKWTAETKTITFVLNNGEANVLVTQEVGTDIVFPDTPTKVGYTFDAWYQDSVFVQIYTQTTMPTSNITVYARFVVNLYIIDFEENGGSVVENIEAPYQAQVSAPTNPVKDEYTFDGWYEDSEFTTPYQFSTMPLGGITLYAKWIDATSVQTIASVLMFAQPGDGIYVSGIVYDRLYPNPMVIGFYIYDGTGSLFIKADQQMYQIGDEVTISGAYSLTAGVPQIEDIYLIVDNIITGVYELPAIEEVSVYDITQEDPNNLFAYGRFVELTGILRMTEPGRFYVFDLTESNGLEINYKSFPMDPSNPLLPFVNQIITINAVVHLYVPMANEWHILYHDEITPIAAASLTDQEIVDGIVTLGEQFLNGMEFPSGSTFNLPTEALFGGTTIEFSTTGEHADEYNVVTGVFAEVDVITPITLSFTVTLNDASASGEAIIYVMPVTYTPIGDLYYLPTEHIYYVHGIVVFMVPDQNIVILADETGFIIAMTQDVVELGDEILLTGYLVQMDGPLMLVGEEGATVIEILSQNNDIPVPHIDLTIEQILSLDPTNPQFTGLFIQTTGVLIDPEEFGKLAIGPKIYVLVDELGNSIPIMAFDSESALLLSHYLGEEIFVRGFLSPTDNPEMPFAVIFNGRSDGVGSSLTPAEYLSYIMGEIIDHFDTLTVRQLAYMDDFIAKLPDGMTGELSVLPSSTAYFNLETLQFADVSEITGVEFEITLYYLGEMLTDQFAVIIEPIETTSIADFLVGDPDTIYHVRGIITAIAEEAFILLSDESTNVFVLKKIPVQIGDEIIISSKPSEFMPGFIVMDDTEFTVLEEIVSHGRPSPIAAMSTSIELVNAIDLTNPANFGKYVEIRGRLTDHTDNMMGIQLSDGEHFIVIAPSGYWAFEHLMDYMGLEVYLKGYLLPDFGDDIPEIDRFVMFLDNENDVRLIYETDLERINALLDVATYMFDGQTVRPGDYFELPEYYPLFDANIEYHTSGINASYYDPLTFMFADTTEELIIEFTITVSIGEEFNSTVISMILKPYTPITIEEAHLVPDGEKILVTGTVVEIKMYYIIIADDYGYIKVNGNFELELGDVIQVRGYKYTGNLIHYLSSYGFEDQVIITNTNQIMTNTPITSTIADLVAIDFTDPLQSIYYVTFTGTVTRDYEYGGSFMLTDGVSSIMLHVEYDLFDLFYNLIGYEVSVTGYLSYYEYYYDMETLSIYVSDYDAPELITGTIADFLAGPEDGIYIMSVYMTALSNDTQTAYFSDSTGIISAINVTTDYSDSFYPDGMVKITATKVIVDGIAYINGDFIVTESWWDWFGGYRPTQVKKTVEELTMLDATLQVTYQQLYRVVGILDKTDGIYSLYLGEHSIYLSNIPTDVAWFLDSSVDDLIGLDVFVDPNQPTSNITHFVPLYNQSNYYPNLTIEEQMSILQNYISYELNGMTYYSLQEFDLPYNLWGTWSVAIEYSVEPEYDSLINFDYQVMGEVEESTDLLIHVRIYDYSNEDNAINFDVSITILPIEITSIADFIISDPGMLLFIKGTVVAMDFDENTVLLYDGFDFLFVPAYGYMGGLWHGDEVIVQGSYVYQYYKHYMSEENWIVSTSNGTGYEMDAFPVVSMQDLFLNSPTDASFYGTTMQIDGTVLKSYGSESFIYELEDGLGNRIRLTNSNYNSQLYDLDGYDISAQVVIYGYREGIWVVQLHHYSLSEYTPSQKMSLIKTDLIKLYQNELYRPDEVYYFSAAHHVFWDATIQWAVELDDQVYANFDGWSDLYTEIVTSNTVIDLIATITVPTDTDPLIDTLTFSITIRPIIAIDGDAFLATPDGEWVSVEVIILVNGHHYMYGLEPTTQTIIYFAFGDWIASEGQVVLISGQKGTVNGRAQINWGAYVEEYLETLSEYTTPFVYATPTDLRDTFIDDYYYTSVRVTGILEESSVNDTTYQLSFNDDIVYIRTKYIEQVYEFNNLLGKMVTIEGLVFTNSLDQTVLLYLIGGYAEEIM